MLLFLSLFLDMRSETILCIVSTGLPGLTAENFLKVQSVQSIMHLTFKSVVVRRSEMYILCLKAHHSDSKRQLFFYVKCGLSWRRNHELLR